MISKSIKRPILLENSRFKLEGQRFVLTYCFPLNSCFSKKEFLDEIESLVSEMGTEIVFYYIVEENSINLNVPIFPKNPVEKKYFHAVLIVDKPVLITNPRFLDINIIHGSYNSFADVLKYAGTIQNTDGGEKIPSKNTRGFERIISSLLNDKNSFSYRYY